MWLFRENAIASEDGNTIQEFIAKHQEEITGVLSGFDRLVFRGTLRPISYPEGMMGYLSGNNVRLTSFGRHVLQVSERLKQACRAKAEALGRPVKYLASGAESKEELARGIVDTGQDRGRVGVRAELCRDLPDVRCLSQPREAEAGVGIAHPEVPVLVSVLDASGVWIFKCADPNVVSVFGAGVHERTGVAGTADGASGDEVRAAG